MKKKDWRDCVEKIMFGHHEYDYDRNKNLITRKVGSKKNTVTVNARFNATEEEHKTSMQSLKIGLTS